MFPFVTLYIIIFAYICKNQVLGLNNEIRDLILQCAKINSNISILVNYSKDQIELVAEFSYNTCVAYKGLKCAANNEYNMVRLPWIEKASERISYSCCKGTNIEMKGLPYKTKRSWNYRRNSTCLTKKPEIYSANEMVMLENKLPLTLIVNSSQHLTLFRSSKESVVCSVPDHVASSMFSFTVSVDRPDGLTIETSTTPLNATILLKAKIKGRYKLICSVKDNVNHHEAAVVVKVHVSDRPWKKKRRATDIGDASLYINDIQVRNISLQKCSRQNITVPQNEFYPDAEIKCSTDSTGYLSITKTNITTPGSAIFEIFAWKVGSAKITCRATNISDASIYFIDITERVSPVLDTNPKLPLVERENTLEVTISCTLIGHIQIKSLTLECFGEVKTSHISNVSMSRVLSNSDYNKNCKCRAYYTSDCFEETELPITVIFIPRKLYPVPNVDMVHMERCHDITVSFTAYNDDFYPDLRFEFTSDNSTSIYINQTTRKRTEKSLLIIEHIDLIALFAGTYTLTCTAYNTQMDSLHREKAIKVNVSEPVLKETILTFNKGKGFTDRNDLRNTNISCTAPDQRNFKSLILSCSNEQITSSNRTINITRDLTLNMEKKFCQCNAEYFDDCFGLTESAEHINLQCSQPKIVINNDFPIVVNETFQEYSIFCGDVEDNKLNSTIILECLGETISSIGTHIATNMNFSINSHGAFCTCIIDSYYCIENRTHQFVIDIKYHIGIISYSASGLSHTNEFKEGDRVEFTCIVESNPAPNISITIEDNDLIKTLDISQQNFTAKDSTHWVQELLIQNVQCQDTNVYTCIAVNNVTDSKFTESIQILVKCPLHVYMTRNTMRHIIGYIGEGATISIKVYGYPLPKKVQLVYKSTKEIVNSELYEVTFKETKKPVILVEVLIYRLTNDNFTSYRLNISNGLGEDLAVEFNIDQETMEDKLDDLTIVFITSTSAFAAALIFCLTFFLCKKNISEKLRLFCNYSSAKRYKRLLPDTDDGESSSNRGPKSSSYGSNRKTHIQLKDGSSNGNITASKDGHVIPQEGSSSSNTTASNDGLDSPQEGSSSSNTTASNNGLDSPQEGSSSSNTTASNDRLDSPQEGSSSSNTTASNDGLDSPQEGSSSSNTTASNDGLDSPQEGSSSSNTTASNDGLDSPQGMNDKEVDDTVLNASTEF